MDSRNNEAQNNRAANRKGVKPDYSEGRAFWKKNTQGQRGPHKRPLETSVKTNSYFKEEIQNTLKSAVNMIREMIALFMQFIFHFQTYP